MINPFVSIILVDPENADNIGAVCRSMKNMGLRDLRLVRPVKNWKSRGKVMATSADDVLAEATLFKTVEEAIADRHMVIGTSRREGPQRGMFVKYEKAIRHLRKAGKSKKMAIMFGRESKGLDNDSLNLCDWVTTIPVHPDHPSINLAQAVMLMAFSIFDAKLPLPKENPKRGAFFDMPEASSRELLVSKAELLEVLDRLDEAWLALGYGGRSGKATRIRKSFHRLFKRSGLLPSEAQMFRGLVNRISKQVK